MADKPKSLPQRWADAAGEVTSILEEIAGHLDDLDNAVSNLRSLQEEYEEKKDNMPENLSSGPYAEKLEEVCNLDIEDIASELRSAIDEAIDKAGTATEVDLPRGFGRD